MKNFLLKTSLLFSFSVFFGVTIYSQTDLSSVLWDQDEIICKEAAAAEGHLQQSSYRNAYANQTDIVYQRNAWEIDPNIKYIKGVIKYYFKSHINNLNQFILDLSDSMTVLSIQRNGNALSYTHVNQLLTIDLNKTLNAGDYDTLTVSYEGTPPSNGFGSFEQGTHGGAPIVWTLSEPYGVRDWWPGKQDLIDKIDSMDVYITTPLGNLAASNGVLVSIDTVDSKLIHHWRHRHPIAGYLVALAVTNYAAFSQYVPLPNGDSIHVLNYVYPETLSQSEQAIESTIDIMKFYNDKFITYPWADEKYGHAQFGWGGGQEHQTMAFMGGFSFGLISHEMAHQWFGDKVTCGSWHDVFLNEGFATFGAGLCLEEFSPTQYWPQWKSSTSNSATSQPGGSVYVDDTTSVNRIFDGRLSYNKGAYLLHMLRWVLGDDDFFKAIRTYLNTAGDFGTIPELQGALENQSGLNLHEFFADWYYGQGYPTYDLKWSHQSDSLILALSQKQSHPSVSFFEMPVPVLVKLSGVNNTFVLDHKTNNQRFAFFIGGASVDSLAIDPDIWLLSKNNTIEQVITATGDPAKPHTVDVFPNPAHDFIQLVTPDHITSVEMVDISGRRYQLPLEDNKINVSGYTSGVYTILLKDAAGNILAAKRIFLSE